MKTTLTISFILTLSCYLTAQDTINMTGTPGNFYIDHYDSIQNLYSKNYCWRREEFVNDTLFSIEYLAMNKHHPIKEFVGYYPNGNIAFRRSYLFDAEYSEVHGIKELFYENGNLKERGNYHHGVKYGNWTYFNADGSSKKLIQYDSSIADTLSKFSHLSSFPENITNDTITIDLDSSFYSLFPCASFGPNGIEVIYKNDKPYMVRKYESGKLILATSKKIKMRRLIRKSRSFPDIKLCMHEH